MQLGFDKKKNRWARERINLYIVPRHTSVLYCFLVRVKVFGNVAISQRQCQLSESDVPQPALSI